MAKTKQGKAEAQSANGQRATLKTIAELTGLSLSTVSLSLRGGSALKEETRQRVAEAARQVGYVPDRAGVRLRTGKTNVIALVLDGIDDSIDFARHMIQGVGHAIKGTRYHLTVMPQFERGESIESIRYILDNRTADGVIITHTSPRDPRVQLMIDANFPFVSHGRTEFYTPHAYHDFHAETFIELAVERLAAKGDKSVMLVVGDDHTTNHHNIVTAFNRATAKFGITPSYLDRNVVLNRPPDIRRFGKALAVAKDRPDGIICDTEVTAIAVISGLQEEGVMLGRDIDVVCKQTSDILTTVFPKVDSIEEDVLAAGAELTRLLLRRIGGEDPKDLQTLAEPIVHWRS
jgi:LacI family transcriptional regulator